jgi:cyanate permease
MTAPSVSYSQVKKPRIFYGWTIVAVGFLSHVVCVLGTVRGLGKFISHTIGAAGAPFFGFLHDVTGSYMSSFVMFVIAVVISAFSILLVRAPEK